MERRPHPGVKQPPRRPASARPASGSTAARPGASAATSRPARTAAGQRPGARPVKKVYKRKVRFALGNPNKRLRLSLVALAVVLSLCGGRLFQLQAFDTKAYAVAAARQAERTVPLPATRGTITDRNGVVLAASEPAVNVFCDPTVVGLDPNNIDDTTYNSVRRLATAEVLAKYLGGDAYSYLPVLSTPNTQFVYLKKQVPAAVYRALAGELWDAGLAGIGKEVDPIRSYPGGTLAGNVVGFVNDQGTGSAGLEQYFNQQLAGTNGEDGYEVSRWGKIPLGNTVVKDPVNGDTIKTTIDADLQTTLQLGVDQGVKAAGGTSGWAIAMDVKSGKVLALVNSPSYDPKRYGEYDAADLGNRAITNSYEPGSVEKVITMASLIDKGLITPDTHVVVPPGIESGGAMITDLENHGTLHKTARGVLSMSSNVGTALLSRTMSRDDFVSYLYSFGYGNKTGIELPGEGSGIVDRNMSDPIKDRAAFGQSMSVTGIQITAALAAVANHGIYNPPTLIESVTDPSGKPVALPTREPHRVVSVEAADETMNMMEAVVTQESQNNFGIPGYRLVGKTGTAERADQSCGCYKGFTVSFAEIGPAEDASILIYMAIDQPTIGQPSGAYQVAPYVRDMMRVALPRYGVPMSTTPGRVDPIDW